MEQLMYNANETIWMACMLLVAVIYIVLGAWPSAAARKTDTVRQDRVYLQPKKEEVHRD